MSAVQHEVVITVPGVPIPQGSKNPWGGEANPHTKGWRQAVAEQAAAAALSGPIDGPVEVQVNFVFPRPKAHYRTGAYALFLKPSAPFWHTSAPDLDKLQRAIGDALSGPVLRDDRQIAIWNALKLYGERPRAEITVRSLYALDGPYAEGL